MQAYCSEACCQSVLPQQDSHSATEPLVAQATNLLPSPRMVSSTNLFLFPADPTSRQDPMQAYCSEECCQSVLPQQDSHSATEPLVSQATNLLPSPRMVSR